MAARFTDQGISRLMQQLTQQPVLNFDAATAVRARDAGIEKVIGNNESFVKTMRNIARLIVKRRGIVCSDDLRQIADDYGIEPLHRNAWGGIFSGKDWQCVGFVKSTLSTNNYRTIRTWRLI